MRKALLNEWIKLKHSRVISLSIIGATSVPVILSFIVVILNGVSDYDPVSHLEYMTMVLKFITAIVAIFLYTLIAGEMISREFRYDTFKYQLTIPISRTYIYVIKLITASLWVIFMTLISFLIGSVLSLFLGLKGMTGILFLQLLFIYVKASILFLPGVYLTMTLVLFFRNMFIPMLINIIIILSNIVFINTNIVSIYPFTAVQRILFLSTKVNEQVPIGYSYLSLFYLMIASVYIGYLRISKMEI